MKNLLFELPEKEDRTCRECNHAGYETTDSNKRYYYCTIRASGRTYNGLLKIKLKNLACRFFKQKE